MTRRSSLYDTPDSFGWISIALHWTTAIAIIVLWLVGKSIALQPADEIDPRRSLHIILGLVAWLPLAGRVVWRLMVVHPRAAGQTRLVHALAQVAHYLILAALSVMIISGPLMAWAMSSENPALATVADIALAFHSTAAVVLFALVTLHILAALKHLMFHEDETIVRIFLPRR